MQFKGKGGEVSPTLTCLFCLLAAAHVSFCPTGVSATSPGLTGASGPGPMLTVFAGKAPRGPGHAWRVTSQSLFPISSPFDESITSANTPSTNHPGVRQHTCRPTHSRPSFLPVNPSTARLGGVHPALSLGCLGRRTVAPVPPPPKACLYCPGPPTAARRRHGLTSDAVMSVCNRASSSPSA